MAKQKPSEKRIPKRKNVYYRGREYTCLVRDGRITVKTKKTARGQGLTAGVLSLDDGKWQNGNNKAPLPKPVRDEVEKIFLPD